MNQFQKNQLKDFNAAKQIAFTIENGCCRKAAVDGRVTNYWGAKIQGRYYVMGDSLNDLQNPDATIMGKPAREVFEGFTILCRR